MFVSRVPSSRFSFPVAMVRVSNKHCAFCFVRVVQYNHAVIWFIVQRWTCRRGSFAAVAFPMYGSMMHSRLLCFHVPHFFLFRRVARTYSPLGVVSNVCCVRPDCLAVTSCNMNCPDLQGMANVDGPLYLSYTRNLRSEIDPVWPLEIRGSR